MLEKYFNVTGNVLMLQNKKMRKTHISFSDNFFQKR